MYGMLFSTIRHEFFLDFFDRNPLSQLRTVLAAAVATVVAATSAAAAAINAEPVLSQRLKDTPEARA